MGRAGHVQPLADQAAPARALRQSQQGRAHVAQDIPPRHITRIAESVVAPRCPRAVRDGSTGPHRATACAPPLRCRTRKLLGGLGRGRARLWLACVHILACCRGVAVSIRRGCAGSSAVSSGRRTRTRAWTCRSTRTRRCRGGGVRAREVPRPRRPRIRRTRGRAAPTTRLRRFDRWRHIRSAAAAGAARLHPRRAFLSRAVPAPQLMGCAPLLPPRAAQLHAGAQRAGAAPAAALAEGGDRRAGERAAGVRSPRHASTPCAAAEKRPPLVC